MIDVCTLDLGTWKTEGGDAADIREAGVMLTQVVWDEREQRRLTMEWVSMGV